MSIHARITPSDPSDRRRQHHCTTKFTQAQTLQASAYFTEWRPLALSPQQDLLWCRRGYKPAGECFIRLRRSGRILCGPPTHIPFNSFSTHHSSSTEQHGASSESPKDVQDRPTSLVGRIPPSSWPQLNLCCCWSPKLPTIPFRTESLPH